MSCLKLFSASALVHIQAELRNDTDVPQSVELAVRLQKPDASVQEYELGSVRLAPRSTEHVGQTITVYPVELWSPDTPVLHTVDFQVRQNGKTVGGLSQVLGIRDVAVSAGEGFRLNGKTIKLRGGNLHHDNGIIGAAAFAAAEWRRAELMKRNGFNAIRTSHNPPSAAFLDACDRLGLLVMNEFVDLWRTPKPPSVLSNYSNYFDAHWEQDLRAMLSRDFNHASVVIWSIGNEIPERFEAEGIATTRRMVAFIRSLDPKRPITQAFNRLYDTPSMGGKWERTAPAFAALDIGGYNYNWKEYENDHARNPLRVMAGTETYPKDAFVNWQVEEKLPYVIGGFVWTGMDHLGESGIANFEYVDAGKNPGNIRGVWPYFVNWCGDIDLIGDKKPQSYYRDILWDRSPVEIMTHRLIPAGKVEHVATFGWPDELPSWTWPEASGQTLAVRVFSKAPRVRLELNGKPVAEAAIDATKDIVANFQVPYAPGELKAVALNAEGKELGSRSLNTSGAPAVVAATPELQRVRAGRDQVVYVPIEIRDRDGRLAEHADLPLTVRVSGEAELLGFGTANPKQIERFQDAETTSFRGRALLVLRSTGKAGHVQVKVESRGLAGADLGFDIP